jgi:hypothetical protein
MKNGIIEAEWQAIYLASGALREVGAGLTRSGAADLAAESYLSAATLEGLGRRAIVKAARDSQRSAELEAER